LISGFGCLKIIKGYSADDFALEFY